MQPYFRKYVIKTDKGKMKLAQKCAMIKKQANLYACRLATARISQLNEKKSEPAHAIDFRFSVFVYHMSGLN